MNPGTPRRFAAPAELPFLIVGAALLGLLLVAGLPAPRERVVVDGSEALRRGWAEELRASAVLDPPAGKR